MWAVRAGAGALVATEVVPAGGEAGGCRNSNGRGCVLHRPLQKQSWQNAVAATAPNSGRARRAQEGAAISVAKAPAILHLAGWPPAPASRGSSAV